MILNNYKYCSHTCTINLKFSLSFSTHIIMLIKCTCKLSYSHRRWYIGDFMLLKSCSECYCVIRVHLTMQIRFGARIIEFVALHMTVVNQAVQIGNRFRNRVRVFVPTYPTLQELVVRSVPCNRLVSEKFVFWLTSLNRRIIRKTVATCLNEVSLPLALSHKKNKRC